MMNISAIANGRLESVANTFLGTLLKNPHKGTPAGALFPSPLPATPLLSSDTGGAGPKTTTLFFLLLASGSARSLLSWEVLSLDAIRRALGIRLLERTREEGDLKVGWRREEKRVLGIGPPPRVLAGFRGGDMPGGDQELIFEVIRTRARGWQKSARNWIRYTIDKMTPFFRTRPLISPAHALP